jgi:hypothetical protein
MWRLLFLSIISAGGCSGPDCGNMGAFEFGLTVSNADVTLTFGDLVAGANNDCPDPMAPSGVVSLTINGSQMGTSGLVTFCIPRPDQLGGGLPLGSGVKVVDLNAMDATCTYAIDNAHVPNGTVTGEGVCDNGTNKAGFALVFDGFIGLKRTCGATMDAISVGLKGTVAVKSQ